MIHSEPDLGLLNFCLLSTSREICYTVMGFKLLDYYMDLLRWLCNFEIVGISPQFKWMSLQLGIETVM